jgi:hypothetical protein
VVYLGLELLLLVLINKIVCASLVSALGVLDVAALGVLDVASMDETSTSSIKKSG